MVKILKSKTSKIFLALFIFLVLVVGVFCALLFSNSSYTVPEVKVSASLVDKIREAQKQGSTIELSKEELNEIIYMYFKGKSSGNITVKGVQGDILNNNLKLNVPVNYKGFNILVTSQGTLAYVNNKIQYKPSYFKAGKLPIPESFVFNKLKAHLKKGMYIENGMVSIDNTVFPIGIKDLKIKDDKILVSVEKINISLEDKLKAISEGKNPGNVSSNKNSAASGSEAAKSGSSQNSSGSASEGGKTSSNSKDTSERDAALDRISGGLSAASGSVSTGGQQAVISEMISAVNSMKGNPNANPYSSAGGVRAAYKGLSLQEKAELKSAVSSNVNGGDINVVSGMLGK